ncbi:hypothetical protein F511_34485 [Dorcoceras hygrometricum]|uniref:Reverse transcriptase domain-containing protein n=1 Tax=Dorcoceras hygrometricum TaxID=472368 RepID=A0A2Z7AHJ7_9LAMI|nr:hypothetical protein F511_34485 [Dorcoceras hygrometricum]
MIKPDRDSPEDQEMTTFTCSYGTYAYRRMSFGLCNAPVTFHRCLLAIFSDMVEEIMEVFRAHFSAFGSSFDLCLHNLKLSVELGKVPFYMVMFVVTKCPTRVLKRIEPSCR